MVADLMKRVARRGIALRAQGDGLVVDAPKGALDGELAAEIKAHKPAILAFLAEADASLSTAPDAPIEALPDDAPRTLTVAQERLWYVDRLDPEAATYNLPGAWRLRGELDEDAMARALEAFARRHEILRWTFAEADGAPRVALAEPPGLAREDLTEVPEAERDEALHALLDEAAGAPFDLAREPALRMWLVRLGPADHVLYVVTHAIVWDGWSFDLFLGEVAQLYDAFARGAAEPLPAPPIRFGDYAAWQRARRDGPRVRGQIDWWRERLAGDLPAMDLPFDRPRPNPPGHEGARAYLRLPDPLVERLTALSREEGVTLYMVLLAAWNILLHRYSGQDRIVITTPVRGRLRPELEGLVGVFTNTLFVRTHLGEEPSFRDALARVREEALEAFSAQEAPVDAVLDTLEAARDLHRTSLYQAMFSYQNTADRVRRIGGLEVEFVRQAMHAVYADLNFWVKHAPGVVMGAVDYRTELFDEATVRRLIGHLETLLEAAADDPDRPIGELAILPEDERAAVVAAGQGGPKRSDEAGDEHLNRALAERLDIGPDDTLLALAPEDTPRGRLERALARVAGAELEHADDIADDPWELRDELDDVEATVLVGTPGLWRGLVDAGWKGDERLTAVSLGEGLPADLAAALVERTGALWTAFAPAGEGRVLTAGRVVEAAEARGVGAALPGIRVEVVDARGEILPFGVRGRLRVAVGEGAPDETGDLARLRPDGSLELAGRFDGKVRVGDALVHPRAIEERLTTHPAVSHGFVAAPLAPAGERRLVAWVVLGGGPEATATELRAHVAEALPADHVPGVVLSVDRLPRTPSGAVDRARLPDPFAGAAGRVEPETRMERLLADVWAEALRVPGVGATDRFGDLGGSSLQAMRVVLEVQRRTGWQPPPRLLFFQSLRQIAERAPDEAADRAAEAS